MPNSKPSKINSEKSRIVKIKVFLIASTFFLFGISIYLFLYPDKFQTLSIFYWTFQPFKVDIKSDLLLLLIYSGTSYCHAVFMPLFSILLTRASSDVAVYSWAIFWGVIDSGFELMQLKTANTEQQNFIFLWLPDNFSRYFELGKFDIYDIIFIWLGVLSVFYLWKKSN